jgi:hypothetical protein
VTTSPSTAATPRQAKPAHRHHITTTRAAFTATTHQVLNWLADQGLNPVGGNIWNYPPTMTVEFGAGSGWLWGHLTVAGNTGRLVHLKAFWTDAEGTQCLATADGPTAIRAELQRQGEHRINRITQLAHRHGLTLPRVSAPAEGSATAGDRPVLEALGWSIQVRKRPLDNAGGSPAAKTVIEIAEGQGPVEVIVHGVSVHYG